MIHFMEEPVDPYAFGIYSAAQLAARHVKVVLGGDGGDEIFGGYDRYLGNRIVDLYCLVPPLVRRTVLEPLIRTLPDSYRYNNRVQKLRWLVAMSRTSGGRRYAQSACFLRFSHEQKRHLYSDGLWQKLEGDDSESQLLRIFDAADADDALDRMLYADVKTRMADNTLMIADRMTMAHSLEARSPLLDQRVAEFAALIPADLKIRGRCLRYIQRKVAQRFLPQALLDRPKKGFGFPLAYWFQNELREPTRILLTRGSLVAGGYFRAAAVESLLDEHVRGKMDHNYRLWLLLNVELWHRAFIEGQPKEQIESTLHDALRAGTRLAGPKPTRPKFSPVGSKAPVPHNAGVSS
jgi:asparagine synthase (glutamine-hydrolysing)